MLFGKNSDRQRNEAQGIEIVPGARHPAGASVRCTYIAIPQVERTATTLLSRPCWMWGAEMGANEHGVAIGNEGLNARVADPEPPALTGMDLLRLGLERAASAAEAVEVMTRLLQDHGQGGNCGHRIAQYYHNGFIVADRSEAFILETIGREWVLARIQGIRGLSNAYTVGADLERRSAGLDDLVEGLDDGPWSNRDLPARLGHQERQHIGHAGQRRARMEGLLRDRSGDLGPRDLMRVLRDHGSEDGSDGPWDPVNAPRFSLCLHAWGRVRGQTVGSLVSRLGTKGGDVHWITGTAAPCLSLFRPVLLDTPLPASLGPFPTDQFDPNSLWWRHERRHRRAIGPRLAGHIAGIAAERDALEAEFEDRVAQLAGASEAVRRAAVAQCWRMADDAEQRWLTSLPEDIAGDAEWIDLNHAADFSGSACGHEHPPASR